MNITHCTPAAGTCTIDSSIQVCLTCPCSSSREAYSWDTVARTAGYLHAPRTPHQATQHHPYSCGEQAAMHACSFISHKMYWLQSKQTGDWQVGMSRVTGSCADRAAVQLERLATRGALRPTLRPPGAPSWRTLTVCLASACTQAQATGTIPTCLRLAPFEQCFAVI